MNLPLSQK
uniref:Uncharacterized protein n=1 Tax=Arundo donax TaxID=35708 RepID=A0A0A8YL61_ARUDO